MDGMQSYREGNSLKTRIFIGGLGQAVTSQDIENTFSQFGNVNAIEIIRSNGRSFGYMDFQPFSDKYLAKVFSVYNGCLWKGGRLRLEKANEHYLARLSREWAEDAQKAVSKREEKDETKEKSALLGKRHGTTPDKSSLHIFFPKLKKLKTVPCKGTGKHKYSFQHVESLPLCQIQICDCDEHSLNFDEKENTNEGLHEENYGGIHEKERSIMNAVMQRLLGDDEKISLAPENETQADFSYTKRHRKSAKVNMDKFNDSDDNDGSDIGQAAIGSFSASNSSKTKKDKIQKEPCNIERMEDQQDEEFNVEAKSAISSKTCMGSASLNGKSDKKELSKGISAMGNASMNRGKNANKNDQNSKKTSKGRLRSEDTLSNPSRGSEAGLRSNNDIKTDVPSSGPIEPEVTISEKQDNKGTWLQRDSWKNLVGEGRGASFSLSNILGGAMTPFMTAEESRTVEASAKTKKKREHRAQEISQNIISDACKFGHESGNLVEFEENDGYSGEGNKLHSKNPAKNDEEDISSGIKEGSPELKLNISLVGPDDETLSRHKDSRKSLAQNASSKLSFHSKETGLGVEEGDMRGSPPKMKALTDKQETRDASSMQRHDEGGGLDVDSRPPKQDPQSSGTCLFMRSENAEDEWLKAKALVRNYAKSERKSALRSMKIIGVSSERRH
eukprot:TRINITY_DN17122_c0_g1_i1.p1 TRINITY_DN17122_c0_g1~~TRINITY_DN17122_c0_g1_i1.p1  ORF type:complete len:672 (+),score=152.02 TRINITY_DN17122_c0_g1_i1:159-2174(+)